MKPIIWMGGSREDLRDFPTEARRQAGHELAKVQHGENPGDWKPMPSVGLGVREIRMQEETGAFRVIYLASRAEAVYVLHCFQKKTQKTTRHDLELASRRFRLIRRSGGAP